MQSIFPKIFDEIAMMCYNESTEAYQSMFEDSVRYKTIMSVLGEMLYHDAHKKTEYIDKKKKYKLMVANKTDKYTNS